MFSVTRHSLARGPQTPEQRAQVQRVADLGGTGGTPDYVCAWFLKAGAYIQKGRGRIGFVATNSITQGEQVPPTLAASL